MMKRKDIGLLVIDVQEKLFPKVERTIETLHSIETIIKSFQVFQLPIIVTEQYPSGLGHTLQHLTHVLGKDYIPLSKTTFSCPKDATILSEIQSLNVSTWVLCGIEAHVCILQTAKVLLSQKHTVIVLNDAISSRSIFDYSTAIAEMRDLGARITSTETLIFELVEDAKSAEFKKILPFIKT